MPRARTRCLLSTLSHVIIFCLRDSARSPCDVTGPAVRMTHRDSVCLIPPNTSRLCSTIVCLTLFSESAPVLFIDIFYILIIDHYVYYTVFIESLSKSIYSVNLKNRGQFKRFWKIFETNGVNFREPIWRFWLNTIKIIWVYICVDRSRFRELSTRWIKTKYRFRMFAYFCWEKLLTVSATVLVSAYFHWVAPVESPESRNPSEVYHLPSYLPLFHGWQGYNNGISCSSFN